MSDETRKVCLGSQVEQVKEFLETYGATSPTTPTSRARFSVS